MKNKVKNNKNNVSKRNRPKQPKKSKVEQGLLISPCAMKYALAMVDPWSNQATGACVPYPPSRPSMKYRAFTRGIVTIGSQIGFIAVSPTLVSDYSCIFYSTSDFAGNQITATNVPTTGVAGASLNLPFDSAYLVTESATFSTKVSGRIVSVGLSLKYIGTELDRGGRVICYTSARHQNINSLTAASLGSFLETEFSTPGSDRAKCWLTAYGIDDSEYGYCEASPTDSEETSFILRCFPFSQGIPTTSSSEDAKTGAPIMGAIITGVEGSQYEFELVQHVEYVGSSVQGLLSPSEDDPRGLSMVQTAMSRSFQSRLSKPNLSLKKVFKQEIVKVAKEVGPVAMRAAGSALLSLL